MILPGYGMAKKPGQTLDVTINGDLIDFDSKEMQGFIKWLFTVFGVI